MKPSLDIEVRVALLESTVVQQNENTNQRLGNIERVLSEIHDKLDKDILQQAITNTENRINIKLNSIEIEKVNGKIAKFSSMIGALVAALITGAFEFFKR